MMKRILLSTMLAASIPLHAAKTLDNYDDVMASFKSGAALSLHVNLAQCESTGRTSPDIEFTVEASPVMRVRSTLVFSETHFTRDNPKHQDESVYEHIRYVLNKDNHIYITAQTLEALTHNPLDLEQGFICKLGKDSAFFTAK